MSASHEKEANPALVRPNGQKSLQAAGDQERLANDAMLEEDSRNRECDNARKPITFRSLVKGQMERKCVFSPCRSYRYTLWREWDRCEPLWGSCRLPSEHPGMHNAASPLFDAYLMVIGLNPSTADETKDDPTIRRCVAFAKRWGYGALCMTNLFAWRDAKPAKMMKVANPVGPLNDYYLFDLAKNAGLILAAWGNKGGHRGRAEYVKDVFSEAGFVLHALRLNGDGSPEHPLYIPADTKPRLLSETVTKSANASFSPKEQN